MVEITLRNHAQASSLISAIYMPLMLLMIVWMVTVRSSWSWKAKRLVYVVSLLAGICIGVLGAKNVDKKMSVVVDDQAITVLYLRSPDKTYPLDQVAEVTDIRNKGSVVIRLINGSTVLINIASEENRRRLTGAVSQGAGLRQVTETHWVR